MADRAWGGRRAPEPSWAVRSGGPERAILFLGAKRPRGAARKARQGPSKAGKKVSQRRFRDARPAHRSDATSKRVMVRDSPPKGDSIPRRKARRQKLGNSWLRRPLSSSHRIAIVRSETASCSPTIASILRRSKSVLAGSRRARTKGHVRTGDEGAVPDRHSRPQFAPTGTNAEVCTGTGIPRGTREGRHGAACERRASRMNE